MNSVIFHGTIPLILIIASISSSMEFKNSIKRKQPHIVFVLADDLGYNDVGYHGGSDIKTPCIDRLAMGGTRLHDYYVQSVCTPTRSQLMSGRYQIHTGLQHQVIAPDQPNGLPLDNIILPQQLKACGYKTHMVGKWHLGYYKKEYLPWRRGFDTFYGILLGGAFYYSNIKKSYTGLNGFTTYDSRFGPTLENFGKYSTDVYAKKASKIIFKHNASKPLFLYLAHQAPHSPLENPPNSFKLYRHIKDNRRKMYARMVSALDRSMCQLEQDLKKASLWQDTILIFSTDNGGHPRFGGNNWPLRGAKSSLWEGGIRAVGFVNGGFMKKRGLVVKGLFHISDWMPTLLHAAKCPILENTPPLDGVNQWDLISQKNLIQKRWEILHNIDPLVVKNTKVEYNIVYGFDIRTRAAIRYREWKLITGSAGNGDWIPPPEYNRTTVKSSTRSLYELYNIEKDPSEKKNLAKKHPSVVLWLLKRLAHHHSTSVPVVYPERDPLSDPALHCRFWSPWIGEKINISEKFCNQSLKYWQQTL